jgi:hypothetical protein
LTDPLCPWVPYPPQNYGHQYSLSALVDVRDDHHKLIRQLGAAGTVLLKNKNNTLPLKKPMNIGVFGNNAADLTVGQYSLRIPNGGPANGDYDIGTMPVGGGSGTGRFTYVVAPLEAIKARGQAYGALVQYVTDNKAIAAGGLAVLQPSPPDVCVLFLKSWADEGEDRVSLIAEWVRSFPPSTKLHVRMLHPTSMVRLYNIEACSLSHSSMLTLLIFYLLEFHSRGRTDRQGLPKHYCCSSRRSSKRASVER